MNALAWLILIATAIVSGGAIVLCCVLVNRPQPQPSETTRRIARLTRPFEPRWYMRAFNWIFDRLNA